MDIDQFVESVKRDGSASVDLNDVDWRWEDLNGKFSTPIQGRFNGPRMFVKVLPETTILPETTTDVVPTRDDVLDQLKNTLDEAVRLTRLLS